MMLMESERRYSIVIADDNEECRESLRDIVEPEGFKTYLASCGEEALEIVQANSVHLVLCDMHMPRLSGLETLQLIRQFNNLLPCIIVSGQVDDRLIRQALLAKAYTVIAKPVSKNVLLYTVVRAITRAFEEQA